MSGIIMCLNLKETKCEMEVVGVRLPRVLILNLLDFPTFEILFRQNVSESHYIYKIPIGWVSRKQPLKRLYARNWCILQ